MTLNIHKCPYFLQEFTVLLFICFLPDFVFQFQYWDTGSSVIFPRAYWNTLLLLKFSSLCKYFYYDLNLFFFMAAVEDDNKMLQAI